MKHYQEYEDHELTLALELAKQAEARANDAYGHSPLASDQAMITEKVIKREAIQNEINRRNKMRLTGQIITDAAGCFCVFAAPVAFLFAANGWSV